MSIRPPSSSRTRTDGTVEDAIPVNLERPVTSLIRRRLACRDGDASYLARRGVLAGARCADPNAKRPLPHGAIVIHYGATVDEVGWECEVLAGDAHGLLTIRDTYNGSMTLC